ncbi:MAG: transmembrane anchor protein [Candidatus Tectimicrobiota bacterium]
MYNANIPTDRELPSTRKLLKSTVLAAVTAVALLVTVVMPAEYGIDPTGVGNAIGLKKMGEIKVSLAKEAAQMATLEQPAAQEIVVAAMKPTPEPEPAEPAANIRTDELQVTLAPNEGTEIKVTMAKGKKVKYSWSTNGGRANFDVHGDSKELNIDYHGYGKGSEQTKEGVIEAAFNGNHGWFWRNRTSNTIAVTLKTSGEYTDIKHMK